MIEAADAASIERASGDVQALFRTIHTVAERRLGVILSSAMRFDAATMTVHRIFSSDPANYPPGGSKPKRDTAWGRHVLIEGRVFVANGPDEIRAAFPDAGLILALGARALVNIPLKRGESVAGTLNLLIPRARWEADEIAFARALGHAAERGGAGS